MSSSVPFEPALVDAPKQGMPVLDPGRTREDHARHGTLVLSLGNPIRHDDGVGAAIIQRLAGEVSLPPDVKLLDAEMPGLEIILLTQQFQRLILIDAADLGLEAGEWVRIPLAASQVQLRCEEHLTSSHAFGLAEALSFGWAMKLLPSEILFYGVQPEELSWSFGLSESVSRVVDAICANLLEALQQFSGRESGPHRTVPAPHELEASSIILSTVQTYEKDDTEWRRY
ncbi:MAG TPA: hydrogenase maturation protease [Anaerolineae bacterium]|nr:hydrogenase maturation protease [Anaerolineae bacterium]